MTVSGEGDAADSTPHRSDRSTAKLWVLVSANRLVVTAALGVVVFLAFVGLVSVLEPPLVPQLRSGGTVETLFTTQLSAVALVTTLTVTIGQVVLSQENGPLGDQHRRMSNAMNVRSYVGDVIGKPSPADPTTFLRELVIASGERARDLRDADPTSGDEQFEGDVNELMGSIIENAETVEKRLEGASFGSFEVISAALDFNYGLKIHEVERLMAERGDTLDADERERFDELRKALSLFAPAREHVKTLYFQWELINLSRRILYLSVPTLIVAGVMVAVVEPASFPGTTLGVDDILWVIAGAFTFTLLPFFLLASYVSRLVSIAQETLAMDPLILGESEHDSP